MSKSKIKGLLHVHTNLSHDGKNSLKEMVDRLRACLLYTSPSPRDS